MSEAERVEKLERKKALKLKKLERKFRFMLELLCME